MSATSPGIMRFSVLGKRPLSTASFCEGLTGSLRQSRHGRLSAFLDSSVVERVIIALVGEASHIERGLQHLLRLSTFSTTAALHGFGSIASA